jgi:hypothetical protein
MLENDTRSDDQADADWRRATRTRLGNPLAPIADPLPFTAGSLAAFRQAAIDKDLMPILPFDAATAFTTTPLFEAPFPRTDASHLSSKRVRRILAARESIFKYGIYLPRNDRDADASPERARWFSGRQLEWIRLKEVGAFEYD